MRDCSFIRDSDGKWRCQECGYVTKRQYELPPRANCTIQTKTRTRHRTTYPGTHLRSLLSWWGYIDNGKCGCESFAAKMDAWGPDGCEAHMGEILDHLRDAAKEQGITYSRFAAWLLVRRAIARARASLESGS